MDLFKIMFGELTEIQKAVLDKAIDLTYGKKGINKDNKLSKEPPIMQDLYDELLKLYKENKKDEKTYRAILNRLGMYTSNGVFSFLNRQTNIDFSKDFVCFNIGAMPKQVKPVIMYLVLDYIYMKMKKNLERKILVVDESWSLLQTAEESSYIFEIVKTCRKFNLGLLMITQDVADLVNSKAGHAVLANTSYTFLLRQKPAVIKNVALTFNLSNSEKDFLVTAQKGQGILILENEHQELEVIASPKEHELITTNPDEMIAKDKNKSGTKILRQDVNIKLDLDKVVYSAWDKNIEERNFLLNNGFKTARFQNFKMGNPKLYFIKEQTPESLVHTFVCEIIIEELNKYTQHIERYRTEKPDIIFTNKKGETIALEIETGIGMNKHLDRLKVKFERVKKEYGDNVYIVLTDTSQINKYKRFDVKLLSRQNIPEFVKCNFE